MILLFKDWLGHSVHLLKTRSITLTHSYTIYYDIFINGLLPQDECLSIKLKYSHYWWNINNPLIFKCSIHNFHFKYSYRSNSHAQPLTTGSRNCKNHTITVFWRNCPKEVATLAWKLMGILYSERHIFPATFSPREVWPLPELRVQKIIFFICNLFPVVGPWDIA